MPTVVKVASEPSVVPAEFVATHWKWYVFPSVSPAIGILTVTGDVPIGIVTELLVEPYEFVVRS